MDTLKQNGVVYLTGIRINCNEMLEQICGADLIKSGRICQVKADACDP